MPADRREYFKQWKVANRDKVNAHSRKWSAANRDKVNALQKKIRDRKIAKDPELHRLKARERLRRWRAANPGKVKAIDARHRASEAYKAKRPKRIAHYQKNKDQILTQTKQWNADWRPRCTQGCGRSTMLAGGVCSRCKPKCRKCGGGIRSDYPDRFHEKCRSKEYEWGV